MGGAITDATVGTFAKLDAACQEELLRSCCDTEQDIGYILGRITIHSPDSSGGSYTTNDTSAWIDWNMLLDEAGGPIMSATIPAHAIQTLVH